MLQIIVKLATTHSLKIMIQMIWRENIDVIVHQEYDHYDSDNLDLQTTALCSWNASASLTCNIYKQLTKDI